MHGNWRYSFKRKTTVLFELNDSMGHYLLFSLASSRVFLGCYQGKCQNNAHSVLFLTWITNYPPADVGQASSAELLLNAELLQKCGGLVVVVLFFLFFFLMKVLFVFSFWGLLKIVWELDCCAEYYWHFLLPTVMYYSLKKNQTSKSYASKTKIKHINPQFSFSSSWEARHL